MINTWPERAFITGCTVLGGVGGLMLSTAIKSPLPAVVVASLGGALIGVAIDDEMPYSNNDSKSLFAGLGAVTTGGLTASVWSTTMPHRAMITAGAIAGSGMGLAMIRWARGDNTVAIDGVPILATATQARETLGALVSMATPSMRAARAMAMPL